MYSSTAKDTPQNTIIVTKMQWHLLHGENFDIGKKTGKDLDEEK